MTFAMRVTLASAPVSPDLTDLVIVNLTYFRHEVPLLLLFFAYDWLDLDRICTLVARTSQWAEPALIRRLLHATIQHSSTVRTRHDALTVLMKMLQQNTVTNAHGAARSGAASVCAAGGLFATQDLLDRRK